MSDIDPMIVLRISGVRTHNEAVEVWAEYRDALQGYLFVLSQPGPVSVHWPAKVDLPGGGYLRSVFAHDKLWFTSHGILSEMFGSNERVDLSLDYTVGFDSNVAQYLRDMVEGRLSPVIEQFRQTLRYMAERRFNWEMMPVLMERSEAVLAGRDLDHVWRLVHASEYFAACDLRHFAATGELRPQKSKEEIAAAAQLNLSEWHRVLTSGEIHRVRHSHGLFHAVLLKTALLHRARPSPRETGRNLAELIDYMGGTIGISLPWMLWAAAGLFEQGGAFEPLRKLTGSRESLIPSSRNIAWDIMHYVDRRQLAQPIGRNGAFLVPYTLTFDRGLAQWFDQQAQRSCMMQEGDRMPQFFSEFNIEGDVLRRFGSDQRVVDAAARHLTMNAFATRKERRRLNPTELQPLITELEMMVAGLP